MTTIGPLCIFLAAFVGTCVYGQTPPPEREERGEFRFYYDPLSHYFVLSTYNKCYMTMLTHAERDHVHTSHGIEDLELLMMRDWLGTLAETKIYKDDRFLSTNVRKWCDRHDIFLLTRATPVAATTVNSIVG